MTQYTTIRPKAYQDDYTGVTSRDTIIAHEQIREPVDSGLLDAKGVKLYRVEEREPIGFFQFK